MNISDLIRWRIETMEGARTPTRIIEQLTSRGMLDTPPSGSEEPLRKFRKSDKHKRLRDVNAVLASPAAAEETTGNEPVSVMAPTNSLSESVGRPDRLQRVPFQGGHLECVWHNAKPYVTMKSVCEPFGRSPSKQIDRCSTYQVDIIKAKVGNSSTWLIHSDDVPWLITTLAHDGMRPDVLRAHVRWTREIRQVLADYFHRGEAHNPRMNTPDQTQLSEELTTRLVATVTDVLRPVIATTVMSAMETHFKPLLDTINRLLPQVAQEAPRAPMSKHSIRLTTSDGEAKKSFKGEALTISGLQSKMENFFRGSGKTPPTESELEAWIRTGYHDDPWSRFDVKRGQVYDLDVLREARLHWPVTQ